MDYFEEEDINEKTEPCCDICGVMLDYFQGSETNLLPSLNKEIWQDYLAGILLTSEMSE